MDLSCDPTPGGRVVLKVVPKTNISHGPQRRLFAERINLTKVHSRFDMFDSHSATYAHYYKRLMLVGK